MLYRAGQKGRRSPLGMRVAMFVLCAVLALCALLLRSPMASADGGGETGATFVFTDKPADTWHKLIPDNLYGLMRTDGTVLLNPTFAYGNRLAAPDGNAPTLFAMQLVGEDTSSRLYNEYGEPFLQDDYHHYEWLAPDMLCATRMAGDDTAIDLYDQNGKLLKEGIQGELLYKTPSGFIAQATHDDKRTLRFLDDDFALMEEISALHIQVFDRCEDGKALYPFQTEKGYGYISDKGEIVIQPQYAYADSFGADGRANVTRRKDERITLIDRDGKELLPYDQHGISHDQHFVALYKQEGAQLLNAQLEPLSDALYEQLVLSSETKEGIPGFAWGLLPGDSTVDLYDKNGDCLRIADVQGIDLLTDSVALLHGTNGMYSLFDLTTRQKTPIANGYLTYQNGRLVAAQDGSEGGNTAALYDMQGNKLANAYSFRSLGNDKFVITAFRFGVRRTGVIDRDGNTLLPCVYTRLEATADEPVWMAQKGDQIGYIDADTGEFILSVSLHTDLGD